ncbi:kinase-like domain-containing protein [Gigaspora rosea]|uniref:Kinase-like domain-containing protein n=1 Tax=Gigaspora rosea TaxID=44941 RepID=A0A397UPM2_9GLOM|nr:kinase-like domain-containing protein [Gigaspora rosea]
MEQESLEDAILRENIKSYDYNEFSNPEQIGKGGFGTVYKSNWKDRTVALKKLNIMPVNEKTIVKEHSKNILVHQEKMLIADFGLAKDEASNKTSSSIFHGMVEYIDPKFFEAVPYEYSKKSDIYSLGVILWEISSGKPPFQSFGDKNIFPNPGIALCIRIREGLRESLIDRTPEPYNQLYKKCWDYDPDQRPESNDISKELGDLWKEAIVNFIIINMINVIRQICFNYNLNRRSLEEISKKLKDLQDLSKQEKKTFGFISKYIVIDYIIQPFFNHLFNFFCPPVTISSHHYIIRLFFSFIICYIIILLFFFLSFLFFYCFFILFLILFFFLIALCHVNNAPSA